MSRCRPALPDSATSCRCSAIVGPQKTSYQPVTMSVGILMASVRMVGRRSSLPPGRTSANEKGKPSSFRMSRSGRTSMAERGDSA